VTATLLDLGRRPYREVWALQRAVHARVACGDDGETWIAVEHDPVVTLGRSAKREHLRVSPQYLASHGVDCCEVERGGDVTYHGPGQVVLYPIRRLERFREVVPLVTALEEATIVACAALGVTAVRRSDHRGVYVGENQLCAIGLAVHKMTSLHGIALNACTPLDYDHLITPCGLPQHGITSLTREARRHVSYDEAKNALLAAMAATFSLQFAPRSLAAVA
jgi:lipoate-protein ligase B